MNRYALILIATLGCAVVACGDNGRLTSADAPPAPDARVAPDTSTSDAATSDTPAADAPDVRPATSRAVVIAGDFKLGDPGVLTTLDTMTRAVVKNAGPALAIGSDPIVRHVGHELVVVNRGENNVTILDDQTLALVAQLSTGANSNPQDVAVVGNKLYVPTFAGPGVTVLTRGTSTRTTIDLSADDPDGEPDCNSAFLIGTELYVSCELLENFQPRGPGKVYVVDTTTDTVETSKTITLTHKNPFGLLEQVPDAAPHAGDLVISTVEDFSGPGCLERITPGVTTSTCMIENSALGGYASRITFDTGHGQSVMWAAVAVFDFTHANLRSYDLVTTTLSAAPLSPDGQKIVDAVQCPSGHLVVIDSTQNANGLRVYDGGTEQTTAALPIGISTFSQHGLVCY